MNARFLLPFVTSVAIASCAATEERGSAACSPLSLALEGTAPGTHGGIVGVFLARNGGETDVRVPLESLGGPTVHRRHADIEYRGMGGSDDWDVFNPLLEALPESEAVLLIHPGQEARLQFDGNGVFMADAEVHGYAFRLVLSDTLGCEHRSELFYPEDRLPVRKRPGER